MAGDYLELQVGKGRWIRSSRLAWFLAWVALFFVAFAYACNSSSKQTDASKTQKAPPASASDPRPVITRPDVGFASHQRLVEHYQKHGREFGSITMEAYLRQAQELRDRPAIGNVLESVRADGVISHFDRASGAFIAFNPDGVIRTYFRPNDGEAYFQRQARRKN